MPKRAQFAPGFAELRGNISGRQNLEYPTNNNKAFEGPIDGKNYARNYRASVIVSQRARDGRFYYSIRTKSMNHLTAKSKKAMALLGGAGAIYAAILKDATLLAGLQAQYAALQVLGESRSFRKYVMDTVRLGLIRYDLNFTFAGPAQAVVVNNPWVFTGASINIQIPKAILVKFWGQLAMNPISVEIEGAGVVIAHSGDEWEDVIDSSYNVLSVSKDASNNIKFGTLFVWDGEEYEKSNSTLVNGNTFMLTDVAPA